MRKPQRVHQLSDATTKENINPLTGELCQPPSKKRKPSIPSVLTCKTIASSSKSTLKSSKLSSGKDRKDKGKKRKLVVMDAPDENQEHEFDSAVSSITLLGNRKAYEFTVMPLADVTQAYDESEASRSFNAAGETLKDEVAETKTIALVKDNGASKVVCHLPSFVRAVY